MLDTAPPSLKDKQKVLDGTKIRRAFSILEMARRTLDEFTELTGRRIAIRHLESRYGEYFVADRLIQLGYRILDPFGARGVDIIAERYGKRVKVEAKTSRLVERFPGAKSGIAWTVTDRQWKDREFDYLVVLAMDFCEKPRAMLFRNEQVIEYFPLSSYVRSDSREVCENYRRIDLCRSFKDWEFNMNLAKTAIQMRTQPTDFERELNKNPETVFDRYDFMKFK